MPGNSSTHAPDPVAPIAEFWTQWFAASNEHARGFLEALHGLGDPEELQRRWLDAVGRTLDDFLRSPAFLEAMQRQLKGMTDLKLMQNQVTDDLARHVGITLASDVTGLYERLGATERAILGRIKAIETKIDALESRLAPPAGRGRRANPSPRTPDADAAEPTHVDADDRPRTRTRTRTRR